MALYLVQAEITAEFLNTLYWTIRPGGVMITILMFALFPHFVKGSALIQNGCNCERKISPKYVLAFSGPAAAGTSWCQLVHWDSVFPDAESFLCNLMHALCNYKLQRIYLFVFEQQEKIFLCFRNGRNYLVPIGLLGPCSSGCGILVKSQTANKDS